MKTKRICKSTVSLILALIMLVSMCAVAFVNVSAAETDITETGASFSAGQKFYLKVSSSDWDVDGARYALYCYNSSTNAWASASLLIDDDSSDIYVATAPSGGTWTNFIWCRMNGANTTNSWDNKWAQTANLSFDGTNDLYSVSSSSSEQYRTFDSGEKIYLKPNTSYWEQAGAWFAAYFYYSSSDYVWVTGTSCGDEGYYEFTVPEHTDGWGRVIFVRMNSSSTTPSFDNKWNQTGNLWYSTDGNCYAISDWGSGSWENHTCTGSDSGDDTSDTVRIYFLTNSSTSWVTTEDAKMFINDGSSTYEMTETVDTVGGHVMWYADVAAKTSYTFYRTSYFYDKSNATSGAWNSWTASSRGTNQVYTATSSSSGSWAAESTVNAADPSDINNFWDDLWIAPADYNDVNHAIKVWYDSSAGKFNLFVPSYVDLSNVYVYTDHEQVTIGSQTITSGSTASLATGEGQTFQFVDGSTTTNKPTINIYQTTSTATMMMTTNEELYTSTTAALENSNAWPSDSGITSDNYNSVYKDAIETKGSYYFYDEEGTQVNSDTVLKKIKGRGNSSFEASMKIYGKYAYNFNLDKKVALIDGATKSKKWCMLANNVDHTMMRNTFIYQLADDLGLDYGPETRLVDVYDNGKYLGAFVITEKVEYGSSTLMDDMENLDDGNVLANSVFVEGTDPEDEEFLYEFDTDDLDEGIETSITVGGQTYKYKYYATYDRPEVTDKDGNVLVEAADNLTFESPENYNTEYNYLLEHELTSRFTAEASWFVTPKGQPVVVKYPEFATQEEMEWIITEYATMEQAVYNDDYETYSELIDVDSFAKMYLIQELTINLDSCATSYYIHNEYQSDGSSKLVAGPVWDYDWSMGAYAKDLKYIYNGSSVVSSENMSNPEQMFVKNKALQTDSSSKNGVTWASDYNLQAKLANNDSFWTECQRIWTNQMAPLLYSYLIDDYSVETDTGKIVTEWLPAFQSSMDMNNARWGVYTKNDDWGTKVTSDYTKGSGLTSVSNFKIGDCTSSGSATKCYENTVYYLNDWLVVRKNYMSSSSGGGLYNSDLLASYEITDVDFTAVQSEDGTGDTVTITPTATVTNNGETLATSEYAYDIYI